MIGIQANNYDGQGFGITIEKLPDDCPYCHRGITPRLASTAYIHDEMVQVPLLCPRRECQKVFIAYYQNSGGNATLLSVSRGIRTSVNFSEIINGLSPAFVRIYQQANIAEQESLLEICGVGYRKALEFLIKDYAIQKHPAEKEKIEKKLLGVCVKDYVNDERVKSVAKRAAWLGNDETHYIRRWEGKNLNDLKTLIRLTIHWLEMEAETAMFEQEMPEET